MGGRIGLCDGSRKHFLIETRPRARARYLFQRRHELVLWRSVQEKRLHVRFDHAISKDKTHFEMLPSHILWNTEMGKNSWSTLKPIFATFGGGGKPSGPFDP